MSVHDIAVVHIIGSIVSMRRMQYTHSTKHSSEKRELRSGFELGESGRNHLNYYIQYPKTGGILYLVPIRYIVQIQDNRHKMQYRYNIQCRKYIVYTIYSIDTTSSGSYRRPIRYIVPHPQGPVLMAEVDRQPLSHWSLS